MLPVRRRRAGLPAIAVAIGAALVALACGPAPASPSPPSPSVVGPSAEPSPSAVPSSPSPSSSPAPASFDPTGLAIRLEPVAEGLRAPLAVTHAGDGSGRLFVAEQGGRIRIVRDGGLVERPFLDIDDRVRSGGEQGLLGLAFHPDYPADPRFFVNYSDGRGDNVIASYSVDPGDPDAADPGSEVVLLRLNQPFSNHNGGALVFGADGFLLIATGDGGGGGDPERNGQDPFALLGKILRIDVDRADGGRPYGIPADNPFASGAAGAPEVWLVGLRNPWRMSVDRATGDLWIGDVGQNTWEEIDVFRAGDAGGANYGWNRMEGAHCFRSSDGCPDPTLRLPVAEYPHDVGCTVIGGNVYRGAAQPDLAGGYVFGDYCTGLIWAISPAGDELREATLVAESRATISSFGEDEAGELYLTDLAAGVVSRLVAERG